MTYDYAKEKSWLSSNDGTRTLLHVYDWIKDAHRTGGAFSYGRAHSAAIASPYCLDSFKACAVVDRIAELGIIRALPDQENRSTQDQIFTLVRRA